MRRFRPIASKVVLAFGLALAIVVTACGGSQPTTTPATPAAPPSTITAPPTATASPVAAPTAIPTAASSPAASPKLAAVVREYRNFSYVQNGLRPEDWRVPAKYSGTLEIAYPSKIVGKDPVAARSATIVVGNLMSYSRLLREPFPSEQEVMDSSLIGVAVPDLAESWSASADGRAWTFKLHQGVKWQTLTPGNPNYAEGLKPLYGREFTADDAAFSVNSYIQSQANQALWGSAERAVAVDRYTLRVDLKGPYFGFPLSGPIDWQAAMVAPEVKQLDGDWSKRAIGTGAFIQTQFDPNGEVRFRRNPEFWRACLPYVDEIVIHIIADIGLRQAGLFTGKFDVAHPGPASLEEVQLTSRRAPTLRIFEFAPLRSNYALGFQLTKPPYNDVRFRQALNSAVNWQEMIDTLFGGRGWVLPQTPWPSVLDKFPDKAIDLGPSYGFDLAKAKSLVDQLAIKTPIDVPVIAYSYRQDIQTQLLAIKDMVAKVGINLIPTVTQDLSAYYAQALTAKYEAMSLHFQTVGSDDDVWWSEVFGPGNKFTINDAEINALRDQQRAVPDPRARRQLALRAWQLERDKVYRISLIEPPGWFAISPRLRNDAVTSQPRTWPVLGIQMSEVIWLSE